jgi:ribosomal-protein-serine acetyltransferase
MSETEKEIPRQLESERLLLRCPLESDGPAVNAAIRASWPELTVWMPWAQGEPPTVAETCERTKTREAGFEDRSDFSFGAFEKISGEFVGMFSLFRFDWDVPSGEIGYWIATAKTGQGFATEVTEALTGLGVSLGLVRTEIRCDAKNTRSRAVAERAGFTLEGILRSECRDPQGKLRDTCVFARVGLGEPR